MIDSMDPENGLLDCLAENDVINDAIIEELNRKAAYRDLNSNLFSKHIAPKIEFCCIKFLKALIKNEQEHIVKFIVSSVADVGWKDRLLTNDERDIIENNTFCLMNLINPFIFNFLGLLTQSKCITRRHKDKVVTWYDQYKNVQELLKIMQRRTYKDFANFRLCLSKTMQNKIIEILDKGGVVEVSVKLLKRPDKKLIESKLVEILTGYVDESKSSSLTEEQRIFIGNILKELEDAGIHFIGNCSMHSMALYFQYDTDEALQVLKSFCGTGILKESLETLYCFICGFPESSPCLLREITLKQWTRIHKGNMKVLV